MRKWGWFIHIHITGNIARQGQLIRLCGHFFRAFSYYWGLQSLCDKTCRDTACRGCECSCASADLCASCWSCRIHHKWAGHRSNVSRPSSPPRQDHKSTFLAWELQFNYRIYIIARIRTNDNCNTRYALKTKGKLIRVYK